MKDLVDVAAELQAFAEERGWEFCFIGGLAVQALAEPRLTRDTDMTLLTGFGSEEPFIDALLRGIIENAGKLVSVPLVRSERSDLEYLTAPGSLMMDVPFALNEIKRCWQHGSVFVARSPLCDGVEYFFVELVRFSKNVQGLLKALDAYHSDFLSRFCNFGASDFDPFRQAVDREALEVTAGILNGLGPHLGGAHWIQPDIGVLGVSGTSAPHTPSTGNRFADILHVATGQALPFTHKSRWTHWE